MWVLHIADVTKTAGRVEHNHNRTTAGCYDINKKGTMDDAKWEEEISKIKIKINFKDKGLKQKF
jgi:hypothetical protein